VRDAITDMQSIGFEWLACMKIGGGCKVHLADGELPKGRLVVVSRHSVAVIDGVVPDTFDDQRGGTRCVRLLEAASRDLREGQGPPPDGCPSGSADA
jgi:hypothetical protein